MKCSCGTKLQHTHNYAVGDRASSKRLCCPKCGTVYTSVELVIAADPDSGQGAYSVAQKTTPADMARAAQAVRDLLEG